MTTVLADQIQASVPGNPVNIRRLVLGNFQNNPATSIEFDSSGNVSGKSVTLKFTGSNGGLTPIGGGTLASPDIDNNMTNLVIAFISGSNPINGITVLNKLQVNTLPTNMIISNPKFISGTSSVEFTSNGVNTSATTNMQSNTPDGSTVDITFPGISGSLIGPSDTVTYTTLQTFTSGIKTNTISAIGVNDSIIITPNGTGSIVSNNQQIQKNITAKTLNNNLNLSGNGTGTVAFDTNGIKFTTGTGILKDYTVGTFTTNFICGLFNSGSITIQFERIGKRVILRVPSVTGTPNVDQVWTANIPISFQPSVAQIETTGVGVKNNATLGIIFSKFQNVSSFWTLSFNDDVTGFGTTGVCGWQNAWSVSYFLN